MNNKTVRQAIKGNKKAFGNLVEYIKLDGYKLAYYYLKNEADSQDALCNAIEKAYLHIATLKDTHSFKSWFLRIVANEAKMILRNRNKVLSIEDYLNTDIELTSETKSMEDFIVNQAMLRKAMDHLTEEQQALLMLKYYDDYTFKEISIILNIPESTVKTRNYTILKRLKELISDKEDSYVHEYNFK